MRIEYSVPSERSAAKRPFHLFAGALVLGSILLSSMIVPPFYEPRFVICFWKNIFGFPCAGCGMTRAFLLLGHGQIREAFQMNPASPLAFGIVILLFLKTLFHIVTGKQIRIFLNTYEKIFVYLTTGCIVIMVLLYNITLNQWL